MKNGRPSEPPPQQQRINGTINLLGAALRKSNPRLPASLRRQILCIIRHWLNRRQRNDRSIHPGIAKMAGWADASERTARKNLRTLEDWGAVVPTEYLNGGRRATRFRVEPEMLFRALVGRGCNLSPDLRDRLNASAVPVENPEHHPDKPKLSQRAMAAAGLSKSPQIQRERPAWSEPKNPEQNPEAASAGIQVTSTHDTRWQPEACGTPATKNSSAPHLESVMTIAEKRNVIVPSRPCASRSAGRDRRTFSKLDALHPDAAKLLRLIEARGPTTYGAAASSLGWGATRACQAEAELR